MSIIKKCCPQSTAPAEDEPSKDEELKDIYNAIDSRKDKGENKEAIKRLKRIIGNYPTKSVQLSDRLRKFRFKHSDSWDSLLHCAVKWNCNNEFVKLLVESSTDIITLKRTGSFCGQTALHMALERRNNEVIDILLEEIKNMREDDRAEVFSAKAVGSMFKNNIMLGEIPLSVAIFQFDKDMVGRLIEHGARINEVNSKGDTVVHSLIKYAAFEHTRIDSVINMLKYINKKVLEKQALDKQDQQGKISEKHVSLEHLWFKENADKMTPLKLAVKEGLADVVEYILNSKGIFCKKETERRTPDTRLYDITEIDPIAQKLYSDFVLKKHVKKSSSNGVLDRLKRFFKWGYPLSVLEMLNDLKWHEVQPLLDIEIIQIIISKRWKMCRLYFWLFFLTHMIMMVVFTTSAYYRKITANPDECDKISPNGYCQLAKHYSQVAPWLLFLYGLMILIFVEIKRLKSQGLQAVNHRSNTFYRFSLAIFAISLIIDSILYAKNIDNNDIFVVILLCGSFFILFFLRAFKKFSFYTVLFQKILRGDLLRFGVIILIEFSAYTFAMYIVLSGNAKKELDAFSNFDSAALSMFNYMLGLNDLDIIDKISNRETKRLVVMIYFLYIVTTYIILINSLIAMMSSTANAPYLERKKVWLLEMSSVAIFLSVLPGCGQALHDVDEVNINRYYVKVTKELMKENRVQIQSGEIFTIKDVRRNFVPFKTRLKDLTRNLLRRPQYNQNETKEIPHKKHEENVGNEMRINVPVSDGRKEKLDIYDIHSDIEKHET